MESRRKYIANVLSHVADDPVCLPRATVVGGFTISEDLQSTGQATSIKKRFCKKAKPTGIPERHVLGTGQAHRHSSPWRS